jgi:hypothetical protein
MCAMFALDLDCLLFVFHVSSWVSVFVLWFLDSSASGDAVESRGYCEDAR